jgi:predicted cupin superfamily sugar epimerase
MHPRAAELIATLQLTPHPEGGYFREVFRSTTNVVPADGRGARSAATTIYFLLARDSHSRWHRVQSDEIWHLYEGGPLELLELDTSMSRLTSARLGVIGDAEAVPVHTVVAGNWQAARPLGDYALVGCTVAPGFVYDDFRLLVDDPEGAAAVRARWPAVAPLM